MVHLTQKHWAGLNEHACKGGFTLARVFAASIRGEYSASLANKSRLFNSKRLSGSYFPDYQHFGRYSVTT